MKGKFCAFGLVLLFVLSMLAAPVQTIENNDDEFIEVTTDKYCYDSFENVEITVEGDFIVWSITILNFLAPIIFNESGDLVVEPLLYNGVYLWAMGAFVGTENHTWDQAYKIYNKTSYAIFPPLIPPSGQQVPNGKYTIFFGWWTGNINTWKNHLTNITTPAYIMIGDCSSGPIADAGADQEVNEGDVTQLDGSNSSAGRADPTEWVKGKENPVLDLGPSGSWDDFWATYPTILYDGTTYKMWYTGHDGTNARIGYATSPDGTTWTKFAGNPVLAPGPLGSWDDGSVDDASVLYSGTTYKMWYAGFDGANWRIGYAASPDGITWTKDPVNPVLNLGPPGSWEDRSVYCANVVYDGTTYKMWYTGYDGANSRIGYATSSNGITWTKSGANPVVDLGPPGSWDDKYAYHSNVLHDGTIYEMWYSGDDGTNGRIGYATSPDGTTWTKSASNPVLEPGPSSSWDDVDVYNPSILYDGTTYKMWYSGDDGSNNDRIGYAISSNISNILSYEWDFTSDGTYDYIETPNNAPDGDFDGKTTHVYGDNGIYTATLRVTDETGAADSDNCNITVLNVDPTITTGISAYVIADVTLRLAGEKWHDATMHLYENGTEIGTATVVRFPGSPDDQSVTIEDVYLDLTKEYSAQVVYTPDDDPVNGQPNGANPAWIILTFEDGSEARIHHTFNVKHPETWEWNVVLNPHLVGHEITLESSASDPGSDDLTFDWGLGAPTIHYNDGLNPDPYPSPDGIFPFEAKDVFKCEYPGSGILTLSVADDDGGTAIGAITLA